MSSPSLLQFSPELPHSPPNIFADQMRINTPYPEMAVYQSPYPVMYGYPATYLSNYPTNYNIQTAEMLDGPSYDPYNSMYSNYPPQPYPTAYYNMPTSIPSRRNYNSSVRAQEIRQHRQEIDELNDQRRRKKPPLKMDDHPEAIKDMLYDTLQQEMSALEVLKQQIASFTLLTHSLEQNERRSSTTLAPAAPQMSSISDESTGQGVYSIPAQNLKPVHHLTSNNFIHPPPYYSNVLAFPAALSEPYTAPHPQLMQYNPYHNYSNNFPPQMTIPEAKSSFLTMEHSNTTSGNIPQSPYIAMPMDAMGNSYPSYQPPPPSPQMPIYMANTRRHPESALNTRNAADSYPDSFHDLAIRTLYDVENKLKEANEKISAKINQFESEVSAQSLAGGGGNSVAMEPMIQPMSYTAFFNPYGYAQPPPMSNNNRDGGSTDMNPSSVKELAVRALKAIDRRLRAAEKTIDRTVSNFDGMAASRAVKSPTREVGVQTPVTTVLVYDSDSDVDSSNRMRTSDESA